MNVKKLARFLGWFSIGLGAAELLATRKLARGTGLGERRMGIVRLYGLREIVKGIGVLASGGKPGWLWARVAGDALDLATLATARNKKKAAFAAANVAAVTALDVYAARAL